jgi:hypothetical protein
MMLRKDGIEPMARANAGRDILAAVPGILHQKPDGRLLGAEDGLHPRATLPADRCHLDDGAVRIDRHHRDNAAIGEVYVVERTVGVHEDLPALAVDLFQLRHEALEIAGR